MNLFSWTHNGTHHTSVFMHALRKLYGFRMLHENIMGGALFEVRKKWWHIGDNGGELSLWLINSNESTPSAPYSTSPVVTSETVAYYVSEITKGEYGSIDWQLRFEGEAMFNGGGIIPLESRMYYTKQGRLVKFQDAVDLELVRPNGTIWWMEGY